jgi:uncharacterized protein YhhL (DUF1145 family)
MSVSKIVSLVVYAVLIVLGLTQGDSSVGQWSLKFLMILAAVHAVETMVFFRFCQKAGGSLPVHLLNVFLFGVLHIMEIKAAQAKA